MRWTLNVKYSNGVIAFVFGLLIFSLLQFSKLKVILSIEDLMDPSFVSSRELAQLKKSFYVGQNALWSHAWDGTTSQLCKLRKWASLNLLETKGLENSFSTFQFRHSRVKDNRLLFPGYFDFDCDLMNFDSGQVALAFDQLKISPWHAILSGSKSEEWTADFNFYSGFDPSTVLKMIEVSPQKSRWSGVAVFQAYMYDGLNKNGILNLAILLFFMVSFRLLFGTWKSGFIFVFTVVTAGIILFGLMGVAETPIDVLNNCLFLTLCIAALEDFIFLSHEQLKNNSHWEEIFKRLALPCLLTSLTTIVGFGSLCTSHLSVIARFGFWSALSALIEWGVVFWFLPAILAKFKALQIWTCPKKAIKLHWQEKFVKFNLPRVVGLLFLLVYVFCATHWRDLNISDQPVHLFPKDHVLRQDLQAIKETRGWEADVSIVFKEFFGADVRIRNQAILSKLSNNKNIARIENPYEVIEYFKKDLPGLTQNLIERQLSATPQLKRLVSDDGKARAILYLKESDTESIDQLHNYVKNICIQDGCILTGSLVAYSEFSKVIPNTLLESLMTSLILVALVICGLAYKLGWFSHYRLVTTLLISSFWGPFFMLAFLVWFKLKVNFLTCIFASALVGLTGDNAIQFLMASDKLGIMAGIERRAGGAIQCSLMMAAASLLFLGSYFDPPKVFGMLLCGGLLASLFGDLWLFKSLYFKAQGLKMKPQ